jgi:hypothetical protein
MRNGINAINRDFEKKGGRNMGRKGRYESHVQPYLKDISEWYGEMDEGSIAKRLGIATSTFESYKKKYPELREALKKGKQELISDLKSSLKKKAKGYFYEETKTSIRQDDNGHEIKVIEKYKKYAHPDTGAIHLLLKNLDPEWRNDDSATLELKKEQLNIARERAENAAW